MTNIISSFNIDFLTVGVATAANLILGFVIFFGDSKSHTNRLFLAQTFALSLWSVANLLSYHIDDMVFALLSVRLVIFFAVPIVVIFFLLVQTFPTRKILVSRQILSATIVFAVLVMILNLTRFVFAGITLIPNSAPQPIIAPGILLFMLIVAGLPASIIILIRKYIRADIQHQSSLRFLLIGVVIMFGLIIIFDVIFPLAIHNTRFIPLSAIFTFPFVAFTAYAIIRHHLLNIKVITTEILTFILAIVSLVEVVLAKDIVTLVFRSGVFVLVLMFGILLIKSVLREVKLREELQVLNDKLQIADRMKSQFLSFASHQVKSPMTVVKDYADLIGDGSFGEVPDKVKETARKIHDSADRLIALVNNLLDLRKLEEGKVEYNFVEMDLNALVKNIVEEMKTLTDAKGLQLTLEAPTDEIKVKADSEKIRQVIQNLIDNSVKYTEHGWVKVTLHVTRNTLRVSVSDSGMGIPQELIPKLFEQFNRGSTEAKKIQGTGLGLYIAKQFMEAHHGRVWAESAGPGKGSTFIVEMGVL